MQRKPLFADVFSNEVSATDCEAIGILDYLPVEDEIDFKIVNCLGMFLCL